MTLDESWFSSVATPILVSGWEREGEELVFFESSSSRKLIQWNQHRDYAMTH